MHRGWKAIVAGVALVVMGMTAGVLGMQVQGAKAEPPASSYLSVNEDEFRTVFAKMSAAKAQVMKRQMDLLGARIPKAAWSFPTSSSTRSRSRRAGT